MCLNLYERLKVEDLAPSIALDDSLGLKAAKGNETPKGCSQVRVRHLRRRNLCGTCEPRIYIRGY